MLLKSYPSQKIQANKIEFDNAISKKQVLKKKISFVDNVPRNPMFYIMPNIHKCGNNPSGVLTVSVAHSLRVP